MAVITEADFDPIDDAAGKAQGIVFDPLPGAIAPGDVAARKAQGEAAAAAEGPNVVRERLTDPGLLGQAVGVGREFAGGLADVAENVGNIASPEAFKGALDNPIAGTALGAVRAVAAPLAPLSDAAARGGEGLSQLLQKLGFETGADIIGALGQSAADVLAPLALAKGAAFAKPIVKAANVSKRGQRTALTTELASAEKAAGEKLAAIQSGTEAAKESIQSITEAAKDNLPTPQQLRAQFAPNAPLSENVGAAFKSSFQAKKATSTKQFNDLYGAITEAGAGLDTPATNYAAAGGVLRGARGVTGLPGTRPESIATKLKQTLDLQEFDDSTFTALKDQLDSVPPSQKGQVQGVIDEFLSASEVPKQPTVRDLVLERQRLKAGMRATRDDNQKRQFRNLIGGMEEDIAVADRALAKDLFSADKLYATQHAPFFAQGSITRAIADGRPEGVVDAIYRPTLGAGGRIGPQNKAVEAMTRARELIKDPKEWEQINKAFINKGIQSSFDGDAFDPKKALEWWKRMSDPVNTGNKVLKLGLGEKQFNEINSVFNQMQRSSRKSFDQLAKDLTAGIEKSGKVSADTVSRAQAVTKQRLNAAIAEVTGTSLGRISKRFESIGTGVITTSLISGALGSTSSGARAVAGGVIVLSSKGLASLLGSVQGRSLYKAMLRGTPGTTQASAVARQIENFVNRDEER